MNLATGEKFYRLGEQQRIAFVRILIHQPKWLFLDEATSALDEVNQEIMYGLVKKFLPVYGNYQCWAPSKYYEISSIMFKYRKRHKLEFESSKNIEIFLL